MKKFLVLVMVLAIVAPAMAVSLTTTSPASLQMTVGYAGNGTTAATRVAGFGLVISVDNGAIITACTPAKTGVSTAASKGYGITIPTMTFDSNSNPTGYGTGIDPAKTGLPSALNSSVIRVSYGALYSPHGSGDVNAPGATGNLFTITVDKACTATITETPDQPLSSGGVVFEDGSVPSPELTASFAIPGGVTECVKNTAGTIYADWVAWGKPSCWCFQRNCRGDINGVKTVTWVSLTDLNALKAAYGKSDALLAGITNGICADLNHVKTVTRVSLTDLNALKAYYGKSDALTPVCDMTNYNFWTN